MRVKLSILTGRIPNLPWWLGLFMTDEEIRQYNYSFLHEEIIEYDDDERYEQSNRKETIDSISKWMEETL